MDKAERSLQLLAGFAFHQQPTGRAASPDPGKEQGAGDHSPAPGPHCARRLSESHPLLTHIVMEVTSGGGSPMLLRS